jgi:hypothetical protein
MSNFSNNNSTSVLTTNTPSLDELLESLGFTELAVISTTFVLSFVCLVGIVLCTLSVWIFFRETFKDPVFVYYRLLCIVYIFHLIQNLFFSLFFTPRYMPASMDNYLNTLYQTYFYFISQFLFHYEETLQVGILLMRMKIFSPFVKKYFTASPQIVWSTHLWVESSCRFVSFF